jgi:1-hydroxycarotenoid 3,4-desaturase
VDDDRVVVIGAGVAGLAVALELACRGVAVTVVERAEAPGGKMREVAVGGTRLDAGPTVFTMRWVFDELFAAAGSSLAAHLRLQPVEILARHAWSRDERLDLFADTARSADAIAAFAGSAESRRYLDFCARARAVYQSLEGPFIRSSRPSPLALVQRFGLSGLGDLWRISPFATLWSALGEHFHDPRLRQLFGRYATYCGSSPFLAPATLMLVAHVEQDGVWLVEGGMHRVAVALADLAQHHGASLRYGAEATEIVTTRGRATGVRLATGDELAADAVVVNADVAALASGCFGTAATRAVAAAPRSARSLSAVTWSLLAATEGFPLLRHTVFFSDHYAAEFNDIFRRSRLPTSPTVYVCAQDRADRDGAPLGPERLLCLVNAPPTGDTHPFERAEIEQCAEQTFRQLERCGLRVHRRPEATVATTPADFERLYPATGGALYGRASHGWMASFSRPGATTRLPGLYLAGGSVHPGPGVPMAALSGRIAAATVLADLASTRRSHPAVTAGGTSTP